MSNLGKRFNTGLLIVGASFVAIGFYLILYQEGYYYQKLYPFRDAGIVVFVVGALFLMAGFILPAVQKEKRT
ncbi:MAG TPA: hypothetical protein VJ249_00350 [Candidatus Bathyarchaeia archaeon]|nr:hypothetical protein [Candidatus Bathyarchaeia archaeon]